MQAQSDKRRKGLETAQKYFQFLQDTEEEDRWVCEKIDTVRSPALGKDLNAALVLLKKHDVSGTKAKLNIKMEHINSWIYVII